jgi:hypothetical protein
MSEAMVDQVLARLLYGERVFLHAVRKSRAGPNINIATRQPASGYVSHAGIWWSLARPTTAQPVSSAHATKSQKPSLVRMRTMTKTLAPAGRPNNATQAMIPHQNPAGAWIARVKHWLTSSGWRLKDSSEVAMRP